MRDKIKLKSRNRQKEINPIQKEFIYEKNISKEIEENDAEKYEKLIVNKIIYYLILCEYSQKMILKK